MDRNKELFNKYFEDWSDGTNQDEIQHNLKNKGYKYDPLLDDYKKDNRELECTSLLGKKYKLYGYNNCEIIEPYIVDNVKKIYRCILLSDFKDINHERIFIYKKKFICNYINGILYFFNRKQFIRNAGIYIVDDLEPLSTDRFTKLYFSPNGALFVSNPGFYDFYDIDDEKSIDDILSTYYNVVMLKHLKCYSTNAKIYFENKSKELYKNVSSVYKKSSENEEKRIKDFEYFLLPTYPEYIEFCEKVLPKDFFYKQIKKVREVWKNIKNNIWINYQFENNNIANSEDFIQGEDYSFLIFNLIKAFEFLLYRIINIANIKLPGDKDIDDRIMLDSMIKLIKENKDKLLRQEIQNYIDDEKYDEFIKHLNIVRDKCRNGYFHKDRMDSYESLHEKREFVFHTIVETIALIGNF